MFKAAQKYLTAMQTVTTVFKTCPGLYLFYKDMQFWGEQVLFSIAIDVYTTIVTNRQGYSEFGHFVGKMLFAVNVGLLSK